MKPKIYNTLGMKLDRWEYYDCIADFGIGKDWACLYDIISNKPDKGNATKLLKYCKKYYEKQGRIVNGSIPLNTKMMYIYKKLGYKLEEEDKNG